MQFLFILVLIASAIAVLNGFYFTFYVLWTGLILRTGENLKYEKSQSVLWFIVSTVLLAVQYVIF